MSNLRRRRKSRKSRREVSRACANKGSATVLEPCNDKLERAAYAEIKDKRRQTLERKRKCHAPFGSRWLAHRVDAVLAFTLAAIAWSTVVPSWALSPFLIVPLIGLSGVGLKSFAHSTVAAASQKGRQA